MIAEIILVPLSPQTLESAKQSARQVARTLSAVGAKVREQTSLCTNKNELQRAVADALARSNLVFILGGLEKEQAYLTKQVLGQGLRLPLEENPKALASVRAYCEKTGEIMGLEDEDYAHIPRGAVVFPGQYGKAPGFAISSEKQHIIAVPENPSEIPAMMSKYITPYLGGVFSGSALTRTVRTYGLTPDKAGERLGALMDTPNPAVTVETDGEDVLVRVTAHAPDNKQAGAMLTPTLRAVIERMGDAAYGLDVDSLQSAVIGKLQRKDLGLALVESGMGGIMTRILAETPGGADVLRYSVAADDDERKKSKLGIDAKLLRKHGGVSEACAVAMANAVRRKAGTDLGAAVTLGLGEGKKQGEGTVYIAVCDANNVYVKKLVVGAERGGRDAVTDAALSRAMNMVRLFVDYLPGAYPAAIPLEEALNGRTVCHADGGETDGVPGEDKAQGFWRRLGSNFIIRKADETNVKVRKFIFILAVLVFLGSAGYVGMYYAESYFAAKQAQELHEMFTFGEEAGDVEIREDFPDDYLPQFATLWSINPDVVGYVSIQDTILNYPVVQYADDTNNSNAYYLRRDFYGKSNQHGIPFLDYRADIERPSDNLIIYGHNMKDGQLFGELVNYQDPEYLKEHPTIMFSTLYEQNLYKVFSVFITNAYENQGPVFDYHNFINSGEGERNLSDYAYQVRIRSLVNTPVDVREDDKLITLSTCTYEFKDARFVVVARALRPGEDDDVDVTQIAKNPQPLMPDIWYKTYGGTKPTNFESASVVTTPMTNTPSQDTAASTPPTQNRQQQAPAAPSATPAPSSDSGTPSSSIPESSVEEAAGEQPASSSQPAASSSAPESSREPTLFDGMSDRASSTGDNDATGDDLIFHIQTAAAKQIEIEAAATSNEPSIFDGLDVDPRKSRGQGDSYEGDPDSDSGSSAKGDPGDLTVMSGGKRVTLPAREVIARVVQNEVGSGFHVEAIKAQAVAAYTYIRYHIASGLTPGVVLAPSASVSSTVQNAVDEVLGETVYYNGGIAMTPYHATSAGTTTSSKAVWGGSYAYLVPVDSAVDKQVRNFRMKRTYYSDTVAELLSEKLGIAVTGDPSDWFEILDYEDGGYVGTVAICGETVNPKNGRPITGRTLREAVFGLRSACFTIHYDADNDYITFVTDGYGHGVGMSQNGANQYAQQGWGYKQILEHYYPGTTIE